MIVGVGLVVGGAALTVELICAKKNHPKQAKQVEEAAGEFSARFDNAMKQTVITTDKLRQSVRPAMDRTVVGVGRLSVDAVRYANRASIRAWATLTK